MHQNFFCVGKRQEILMVVSSSNLEMCRSLFFRDFFSILGFFVFFFSFCFVFSVHREWEIINLLQ